MKRALAERAKQESEELYRGKSIGGVQDIFSSEIQEPSPTDAFSPLKAPPVSSTETEFDTSSPIPLISQKIPRLSNHDPAQNGNISSSKEKLIHDHKMIPSTVSSATPTNSMIEGQDETMVCALSSSSSQERIGLSATVPLPQSIISTPVTTSMSKDALITIPTSLSSLFKNPKKRSRSATATPYTSTEVEVLSSIHTAVDGDDQSVDNTKGFYLLHQNRALTSELFQYKRIIRLLEEERSVRRQECKKIATVLGSMISSWIETESVLVGTLQDHLKHNEDGPCLTTSLSSFIYSASAASVSELACTGTGTDVEQISNIVDLLSILSKSPFFDILPSDSQESIQSTFESIIAGVDDTNDTSMMVDDHDLSSQHVQPDSPCDIFTASDSDVMKILSLITQAFTDRCNQFHKLLLQYFRLLPAHSSTEKQSESNIVLKDEAAVNPDSYISSGTTSFSELFDRASLHRQLSELQNSCVELENQLEELANARDEAYESERRVRRALYRLASGRLKLGEVLQIVEKSGSVLTEAELNACKSDVAPEGGIAPLYTTATNIAPITTIADAIIIDSETVTKNDILDMRKKINDFSEVCATREQCITELVAEKESIQKKIITLTSQHCHISNPISDTEVKNTTCYKDCDILRAVAVNERDQLKIELERTVQQWSATKGDLSNARKTVDDLLDKHSRRWKELVNIDLSLVAPVDSKEEDSLSTVREAERLVAAQKISELEYKLQHALDAVRQVDSLRASLADASQINDLYQTKIEELKVKISGQPADPSADHPPSAEIISHETPLSKPSKVDQSHSSDTTASMGVSEDKALRKLKKELAAALSSKEQAKARQERAEKERDTLMKLNARFVKQCAEKDEMNAKSLSTILQLKQLSEQLEREKETTERKLKGVEQLALAARLATNAKERVDEEIYRERDAVLEELTALKDSLLNAQKDQIETQCKLKYAEEQLSKVQSTIAAVTELSTEMITRNTAYENEIIRLKESIAIAKKESLDAFRRAEDMSALVTSLRKNASDTTEYGADLLLTQVNHLKGRLACPVCNTRDKQVILLRCRHMFCRQCVDTSIKNRSRKCPACGQRFDTKDVGDVWL